MGTATFGTPAGVEKPQRDFHGSRMVHYFDVVPSGSYATGGETLAFPQFKVSLDFVAFERLSVGGAVYTAEWVRDTLNALTGKLKVYNALTGAEIANAVDLSALTFRCRVEGR
jgi:hypothetical protein